MLQALDQGCSPTKLLNICANLAKLAMLGKQKELKVCSEKAGSEIMHLGLPFHGQNRTPSTLSPEQDRENVGGHFRFGTSRLFGHTHALNYKSAAFFRCLSGRFPRKERNLVSRPAPLIFLIGMRRREGEKKNCHFGFGRLNKKRQRGRGENFSFFFYDLNPLTR